MLVLRSLRELLIHTERTLVNITYDYYFHFLTKKMTKEFVKMSLPALLQPDRYGSGCLVTGLILVVFTLAWEYSGLCL